MTVSKRLSNLWILWSGRLRNAVRRFLPSRPMPRPDFLTAAVILEDARVSKVTPTEESTEEIGFYPNFPDYPLDLAMRNGWCVVYNDYIALAAFVFALRYPNHPYSRQLRAAFPDMSDEDIVALAEGPLTIRWEKDN